MSDKHRSGVGTLTRGYLILLAAMGVAGALAGRRGFGIAAIPVGIAMALAGVVVALDRGGIAAASGRQMRDTMKYSPFFWDRIVLRLSPDVARVYRAVGAFLVFFGLLLAIIGGLSLARSFS